MDIVIERKMVNLEALDDGLRAALGALVQGVSWRRGAVVLHLHPNVTPAQVAQARGIAQAHDPAALTPAQQRAQARLTNISDVQGRFAASLLHDKTPAQIFSALETQIDGWVSLADAKRDLKQWLPLLAAAVVWLLVEPAG